MLQKIKKTVGRHFINIPGWRTDRKIVVLESDDWGTVRMSSPKNFEALSNSGIPINKCRYLQNDALASEEDLNCLFDLLSSHKNSSGKNPIITSNVIMTNPNFEKIRESEFTEYHNEIFTKTLDKYPAHKKSFELWKAGIKDGLFHPQFHGREHLQVIRWMNSLKHAESDERKAFNREVFGLSTTVASRKRKSYLASYDWDDTKSRNFILESIPDGLSLFKSVFGFKSLSSIAPNYVWHHEVEKKLKECGVHYIQGSTAQKSPILNSNNFEKRRHYTGQKNKIGQFYLVRNSLFEPSLNPDLDWVNKCLNDISIAFLWKKPAIISTHRVNFIGFINPRNRDRNLYLFDQLLRKIIQKWPDVEFMTSDQLGEIIRSYE